MNTIHYAKYQRSENGTSPSPIIIELLSSWKKFLWPNLLLKTYCLVCPSARIHPGGKTTLALIVEGEKEAESIDTGL